MAKGGGTETTTQTTSPWAGQQPYLTKGFQQAESQVLNRPQQFFPGQTFVNQAPETLQALNMQSQRATAGSPLMDAGQSALMGNIQGDYLSNPYQSQLMNRIGGDVRQGVESLYAGSGRLNSPGQFEAVGRGVGDAIAPQLFGQYENERNRQLQATGMAPGFAQQDYFDIGQLGQVGAAREGQEQLSLQDQIQRFNFQQQEPANRLAQYMGLIQGNYGGTGTTVQPSNQTNPLLQGIGGALPYLPFMFL